jgi:outer membrane protein OmpA-like peptidoglycan-associated protein
MYAVDGRGIVLYDGFDGGDNGNPALQRIRQLELALPVPAALDCSQLAIEPFILEPSQEATFSAGTAAVVHAPMNVFANQGYNGHIAVSTNGTLPSTVAPAAFDIAGGQQKLDLSVKIPASTKPGLYTVTASASNGGKVAQATLALTGNAQLQKTFKPAVQKRIRIYGIHFDYDSAHIQPQSEAVVGQIAAIMRSNPNVRFAIEGYTDSDGGAAYNLGLSQRRAQAVVDDLAARYGIARSRLVARGFGLSDPVASNATEAGKALNRRVELVVLN